MKALLVTDVGQLALKELPIPEITPYQALVRMEACGICNSTDHKVMMNTFHPGPFPTALGHESVGMVVLAGEKVRHYAPGLRVLRPVLLDEHVPGGRANWGGFAEYAIVIDDQAMREDGVDEPVHWSAVKQQVVPAEVQPAQAAAMITLKETLSCLQNLGVREGSSVAIVGTGPVGQAFAFEARLLGASPVTVFGRRPDWQPRFAELGIREYVVGDDYPPAVAARIAEGGYDYVVEAVGSRAALSRALQIAGRRGKVGLYGIAPEDAPWDPQEANHPQVCTPRVEEADLHELFLEWLAQGKLNLDDWYTAVLPLEEYARGFEMVKSQHGAKVILTMP